MYKLRYKDELGEQFVKCVYFHFNFLIFMITIFIFFMYVLNNCMYMFI